MVRSRTWLLAIACLSALGGLLVGLMGDGSIETDAALGGVIIFPLYVLTYLWMKADIHERAVASPPGAIPLLIGLFPVAVPYYLVATRRGWGRGASLLWFLGFVVAALILNVLAALAGGWLAN